MSPLSFFCSNALIAAVSPLGIFLCSLLFCLCFSGRHLKRRGLACLALFAFCCTDFCGSQLLGMLESLAPRRAAPDPHRDAVILVLGGGAVAEGQSYQPSLSSQRRLRHAQSLLKEIPDSSVLLSGIEAPLMYRWIADRRKQGNFILESHSLNTRENLYESARVLRLHYPGAEALPQVILVTDRFHMYRARRWAQKYLKEFDVICSSASTLRRRSPLSASAFIPSSRGLGVTSMAWREALALLRDAFRSM